MMNDQAPSDFWEKHLAQQQAMLEELRALRAAQQEHAVKLHAQEQGLKRLVSLVFLQTEVQRATMLSGLAAADGRHADPLSLTRAYAQVYSQNGEDGITAEIFRRIGTRDRFFVEIGIESGLQCNTRLLLEAGWRGVWLEGSERMAQEAFQHFRPFIENGALKILFGMIGPENIEAALDQMEVPARFDYLSLDIDQHTHSVWRAMKRQARVVCIEQNASIPPSMALEVPFDPKKAWDGSNWFGAGLKAMELIGTAKGMHLVGCDMTGANAFFVTADETDGRFRAPFTAEAHYQPASYPLWAHTGHPPSQESRHWVHSPEAPQLDPYPARSPKGSV
jgi:hypothetical protein